MNEGFDFVVIGGGSAGYAAASTAAKLGLRVAVVEGGEEVGGLCILRGCMPSKTLIQSASRLEGIRHASEFGLHVPTFSADPVAIVERKRRLVGEFAEYRRSQLASGAFEFIRGLASFLDPHTVEVRWEGCEPRRVTARSFLLATGSTLQKLPIPGLDEAGFRDSDAALEWAEVPESVCVLGAGATGLEFAHYYAGLGCRVSVIQRGPQVLKEMDVDVADSLMHALVDRGIEFYFNTKLTRVERTETGGKRVVFEQEEQTQILEVSEIIYALGRVPQTAGMELERTGLKLENGRVGTNAFQQTAVPHIFAAGDVAGPFEIVHIAVQQGELASRNAARLLGGSAEEMERIDYRLKLFAVFTEPQVAGVGATEKELTRTGISYLRGSYLFADHGKALVRGEPAGMVKLLAKPDTLEILGAAAVGAEAAELIHEIVVAMHFKGSAHDLVQIPHYHPTLSEIWTYPAEELVERAVTAAANR